MMRAFIALSMLAFGLTACGGAPHAPQIAHPTALAEHDGREVRLVGVYRGLSADVRAGDPTVAPGWVVLWVGNQPIRLGLAPRPAEERDRWLDSTVEVRGLLQLKAPAQSGLPDVPPALRDLPLIEPVAGPSPP
jgi:hypothetical protein